MRVLLQRVLQASVTIEGETVSAIGPGLLLLLGVETADEASDADWLSAKICSLRIFNDEAGKMNLDLAAVGGDLLVVSQFTLHAAYQKGARPSYIRAARPEQAEPLYRHFIQKLQNLSGRPVLTGVFGADMKVALVNDGPVTILLDSRARE